jgi:hypothetical protein
VKRRILNYGLAATHELIKTLDGGPNSEQSISDFDALVFDPYALRGIHPESYGRRQNEIHDLVNRKGGIVICLLRQQIGLGFAHGIGQADGYGILDLTAPRPVSQVRVVLRAGSGSQVEIIAGARGPLASYFRILRAALSFTAYLDTTAEALAGLGATVFAVDSVPHPIGIEFTVGAGRICFVPIPNNAIGNRVGAAIVRVVEAHYGGPGQIEEPAWLVEVSVPGANAHDTKISELEAKTEKINAEVGELQQRRADLLNYRALLYGYSLPLESVVRRALALLGFQVSEPDDYNGEWDVEMREPRNFATVIGEVEGSEGPVDVDKFRQLLDYVQDEVLEGRDHKGVLIGNGFRLTAPDAPERQNQFSDHALRGASRNGFCLLPATELFKAVCAVLEAPEDEGQKIKIRDSILSSVSVWTFAREGDEAASLAGTPNNDAPSSSAPSV